MFRTLPLQETQESDSVQSPDCTHLRGRLASDVYSYISRSLLTASRKEFVSLKACRRDAKTRFPSLLTGPCRLEGATLAHRLAGSRNYERSSQAELCKTRKRQFLLHYYHPT